MLEFVLLLLLAFVLEMIDNGLGGGFGTILSPLLIIFGYDPKLIVPAILISETVSGLWGGAWHIKFHNVDWKVFGLTLLGSLGGMLAGTYFIGTVLPAAAVKQFISILAMGMGLFVIVRSYLFAKLARTAQPTGKRRILFSLLGLLIGFNKGGSGGNYGPISVTGYMVLGLPAAMAIGTTTVAEGVACLLGISVFVVITGAILAMAIPITIGSFIADPISAWINQNLKEKLSPPFHGRLIGVAMTCVGFIALLKALGLV